MNYFAILYGDYDWWWDMKRQIRFFERMMSPLAFEDGYTVLKVKRKL